MKDTDKPTLAERLAKLLDELGIERAHFAGRQFSDWIGIAQTRPEAVQSLTLVCPFGFDAAKAGDLADRLLVIHGDTGAASAKLSTALDALAPAGRLALAGNRGQPWNDTARDNGDATAEALVDFAARMDESVPLAPADLAAGEGRIGGITYRIQGAGPPLILFPLMLAPSQWTPLIPRLAEHFCTLSLGGPHLGGAGFLETRAGAPGYRAVFARLIEEMRIPPGDTVLEVGSGSGAITRWLAEKSGLANPITGLDVNAYLIGEAEALVRDAGLGEVVTFTEGDAANLPFDDNAFDHVYSSTVMEELDAEAMMAELVRVVRPGGRVGVVVRSVDLPRMINLPLRAELKAKLEAPGFGGVEPNGCADASLYARFRKAGLGNVRNLPLLAAFDDADGDYEVALLGSILGALDAAESAEARDAFARAATDGTFVVTTPFHGAVGTKA